MGNSDETAAIPNLNDPDFLSPPYRRHYYAGFASVCGKFTNRPAIRQHFSAALPDYRERTKRAIVWLDEVRRGLTDTSGKLALTKVSAGSHVLRVRAGGFQEATIRPLPAKRGTVVVRLVRTTDEAELAFQHAEEAREKAKDDETRKGAVELYRQALKLRSAFPAARVGPRASVDGPQSVSRSLLSEIEAARRSRPVYPEASAVRRSHLSRDGFCRRGSQVISKSDARSPRLSARKRMSAWRASTKTGDSTKRRQPSIETAIKQLSDSEPVIYQLLGAAFEKVQKYKASRSRLRKIPAAGT